MTADEITQLEAGIRDGNVWLERPEWLRRCRRVSRDWIAPGVRPLVDNEEPAVQLLDGEWIALRSCDPQAFVRMVPFINPPPAVCPSCQAAFHCEWC